MDLLYVFLLLVIFALAMWAWKLQCEKVEADKEARLAGKERDEFAELGKGLAEFNERVREKKEGARREILEMVGARVKVSNRDVARELNVSSVTAFRYLDELEKAGKLKQAGKSGKAVFYTAV